jgi:hypothetical protein
MAELPNFRNFGFCTESNHQEMWWIWLTSDLGQQLEKNGVKRLRH